MLEREPPSAQPSGVDRTRRHRAEPAGPPRQQSQGSRITGHFPGDDLSQDPRVRDHHPGQLTGGRRPYWHRIENTSVPEECGTWTWASFPDPALSCLAPAKCSCVLDTAM